MEQILAGKTALVTGASRGIGRSIAQKLAASGALVAINYAENDKAAGETLRLVKAAGGEGFIIKAKLGYPGAAEAVVEALSAELMERTGERELDILVNNVGSCVPTTIQQTNWENYHKDIANNIGSTFFLTKELLPRLRSGGRVINISSSAVRLALQSEIIYTMCKGAIDVFTIAMAKELGPRLITVNAVSPGLVETEAAVDYLNDSDAMTYLQSRTAMGRPFGTAEEISGVVHALATPAMGWVTGQIIEATGGFCL